MEAKLHEIYYSPKGYWRGHSAIEKLASAAKVSHKEARSFLERQAIWQMYLPAPKHIHRPIFDEQHPNAIHQADILYLPHDKYKRRTYKYALTVVDVASRFKEAEPLTDKSAGEAAQALTKIYARGPLTWPNLLQVDPGKEFFGPVSQLLAKHNVEVRRGIVGVHRQQGIVERFNRTLAERLFGHQYYQEQAGEVGPDGRSREWVKRLPEVIAALNDEETRLTGQKPSEAITHKKLPVITVALKGPEEPLLGPDVLVRYLYAPGELEGGTTRRATDPIWSVSIHKISNIFQKANQPALYHITDGPQRSFVREELQVIPAPPPAPE